MKFRSWGTANTAQVRIKKDLKEKLQEIAQEEDRTIYYIINKAVQQYLDHYDKR